MKNFYPYEKFLQGMISLVSGFGTIQERLNDAYVFSIINVKVEEMPKDLQYRFDEINRKMTLEKPIGDEGSVKATTNKMTVETASEIASEMFDIFLELHKTYMACKDK